MKLTRFALILFIFSFISLPGHSQELKWKNFNINSQCFFSMPDGTLFKDSTVTTRDQQKFLITIYEYTADNFLLQVVRTEIYNDRKMSEVEEKQALAGMKKGITDKAMGLPVIFKDTAISGISCIKATTVSGKLNLTSYLLVFESSVFAFSSSSLPQDTFHNTVLKRFRESMAFAKDDHPKEDKGTAYRMGEAIGRIIGYLVIPGIITLLIFLFKKKRVQR